MSKKFHFLNHTSILIQHDSHFLLLDPWPTEALSFDSWKSHPPSFLDNNILASFINSSDNKFGIVVSHGHDDHCDDTFLKKINSITPIFFPDYETKGTLNRLKHNDLNNITLLNSIEKKSFGPFSISSYIISEQSKDDAVIIVSTDEYVLVHANDNSVEFPSELINDILNIKGKTKKTFFASQTGIANGFPYCYPQFGAYTDPSKMKIIAEQKNVKTIQIAIKNANLVKADNFISYAAYTMSMSLLEKSDEKNSSSQIIPSPTYLRDLPLNWGNVSLLDYVPGDTFNLKTNSVERPFWLKNGFENMVTELQKIRLDSIKNFKEEIALKADQFKDISDENLIHYTNKYLEHFYNFILRSKSFTKNDIMKSSIEIKIENINSIMLNFKDGTINKNNKLIPNKRITINKNICLLLLSGIYNFESLYIGHHAKFERFPKEIFNKELVKQLEIFGYIYQKRLVPKELNPTTSVSNK